MSERPFALFLTWTTYGTWLPGDRRGSVANVLHADLRTTPRENRPGRPYAAPHERTARRAASLQKFETTWFTPEQALVAAEALVESAFSRRWRISRGAVMANHVHLVLFDVPDDAAAVRRVLKGVSQKHLTERANRGQSRRWWTAGGSDRYLHDEGSILAALRYVERQPGMLAVILENVARATSEPPI